MLHLYQRKIHTQTYIHKGTFFFIYDHHLGHKTLLDNFASSQVNSLVLFHTYSSTPLIPANIHFCSSIISFFLSAGLQSSGYKPEHHALISSIWGDIKNKEKKSKLSLNLTSLAAFISFSPYLQQNTSKELYIHTDSFSLHSTLSSTTPIGLLSLSQSPQQDSLMSPITSILAEPESFYHAHLIQILPNIWLNWSHPPSCDGFFSKLPRKLHSSNFLFIFSWIR